MKYLRATFTLSICLMISQTATAATLYISDELTVPLRSGPSGAHRILHKGLPSGTNLEYMSVDEAAGFTQIRTSRGTEGWIRSQYLVAEPIAKARLAAAQRALSQARSELSKEQAKVRELNQNTREQGSANTSSQQRIAALETELKEINRISTGALEEHAANQKLTEVNARLKDELDDLAENRARLEDNAENEAIIIGAILVILGLLAGVLIKARPQRSAWN
jgi:SH3 domain protein